jgi:hypothetical protein
MRQREHNRAATLHERQQAVSDLVPGEATVTGT